MMSILNMILLKLVFCYTKKKEENHVYNWPKQTKDKNIKFDPLGLFFLHQKSHVNYKYVQLYFPTECQGFIHDKKHIHVFDGILFVK